VAIAGFCGPGAGPFVQRLRAADVRKAMKETIRIARKLGNKAIILTVGNTLEDVSPKRQTANIVRNLKAIARMAEDAGLKIAVEPLNTLVDHKGYFLDRTADGVAIVEAVGSPAVGLLYDVYHMQIMEGNLIETIRRHARIIHHVHVGDVPGRMEPGTGEINYANVLKAIDAVGYAGYCGFEFRPSDNTEAALARAKSACGLA
jgi:hydroxypyruvate isomerase